MRTNKIYHSADLPKWFRLSKYQATLKFSALDWANQLNARLYIQWLLGRKNKAHLDDILELFGEIKENPTHHILTYSALSAENDIKHTSTIVRPLTCGFAYALGVDIKNSYELNEGGNLGVADRYSVSKYYKEHDLFMDSLTPVVVDLNCSDVDIKNDFSLYLKQVRTYTGIESKKDHITPRELEKLQDYSILPYMDLMIWCAIDNRSISSSVILNALFDANSKIHLTGQPFIAKTLKPFCQKINSRFIRAIEHHQPP